ncbi:hypothetical protein G9A89_013444 [Geosiphon pyriformis]|nr:hypothetical protein G9A89_013444 [Geosiphon pyriformis]
MTNTKATKPTTSEESQAHLTSSGLYDSNNTYATSASTSRFSSFTPIQHEESNAQLTSSTDFFTPASSNRSSITNFETMESNNNHVTTSSKSTQTSTKDTTSSTRTNTSTSDSPPPYVNQGLEHWNRQRALWTGGNYSVPATSENQNNPALVNITPNNYLSIYNSLIYERKRLAKPVPLPYVIKILLSGWKRDGIWPTTTDNGSQVIVPSSNDEGRLSSKMINKMD